MKKTTFIALGMAGTMIAFGFLSEGRAAGCGSGSGSSNIAGPGTESVSQKTAENPG